MRHANWRDAFFCNSRALSPWNAEGKSEISEERDSAKITQFVVHNCPFGAGPIDLVPKLNSHYQLLDKLQQLNDPIYDNMLSLCTFMALGAMEGPI